MRTIAFVGPSGTGKSYRSMIVAKQNGTEYIIDDGLLICGSKVIAGTSAKKESTKIASVKHALFLKDEQANEIIKTIKKYNPECVMILGTSDGMVKKIASRLQLPQIEKTIYIHDVATPEEMELAHSIRIDKGQHVIPVPTFEIKQDFSGYFLHPLRILQKNLDNADDILPIDKTIIRPTFSYMGDYTISDNVILSIVKYESEKMPEVFKINDVDIRKTSHGVHIDIYAVFEYGCIIPDVCRIIRNKVGTSIEKYTSVNARRIHVYVRGLHV